MIYEKRLLMKKLNKMVNRQMIYERLEDQEIHSICGDDDFDTIEEYADHLIYFLLSDGCEISFRDLLTVIDSIIVWERAHGN